MQQRRTLSYQVATSPINVPFSWENSPGVSKATRQVSVDDQYYSSMGSYKLPPPPRSVVTPVDHEQVQMHVVPMCNFHGALKSPFNYSATTVADRKPGDPFLAAYIKCTTPSPLNMKSLGSSDHRRHHHRHGNATSGIKVRLRKYLFRLSCKYSCSFIRSDNLVTRDHFPELLTSKREGTRWIFKGRPENENYVAST